ncbi:hypothetical protein [Lacinutrix undariae]
MKQQIIISFFLLISLSVFSQDDKKQDEYRNKGFFNITRFSYINVSSAKLETYSPSSGVTVTDLPLSKSKAYSLQTINGYFFNPNFSVGLGVGLDGYSNPNFNTLPIFVDVRTYFNDGKSSPYLFLDYGMLAKVEGGKNNGTIFNIGFGYKFPINNKRFILVTDLSYSYKAISLDGLSIRKSTAWTQVKGVMLGVGVLF